MNSLSFISLTGAAMCFLSSLLPAAVPAVPTGAERMVFPRDPSVLDLQRDFGAKGDGVADDTAALQRAIEASSNRGRVGGTAVLFVPNGTYLVTSNLVVNSRVGPWVYGESRDGVVIRLTDGVSTNVTAVLRTQPSDTQASSADYFMRNFRHLTIDVGQNPHADGIRWYANNSGILKDVRITGTGRVAINAGFLGQNGPSLIQDTLVEGSFETGVRCAWSWGQTLSRVTVRNARLEGVYVNATAVGIEDLVVENTPVALRNEYPNDWTWWGGVVALVGGRFTGGDPNQPAITNTSVIYARDVEAVGFRQVLDGTTPGGGVSGNILREYTSHPVKKLFADSPDASLQLPIWPEPRVPWETDLANWVCANDHGAAYGDNRDDTAALQAAIDHAAAAGKTVVYLRGISGGDPNWYTLDGEVRLRGSVRLVIGLGFGRVIGGPSGRFIVDDRSAPVVKFMHLQAFGGRPPVVENRSTANTLVVESCDLRVLGTGSGDIFVTDCPAGIELRAPGQRLWARQLNPEGDSDTGLVQNHGGRLWALGVKHEGRGVRFRTDQDGQTEILGWFNYPPDIAKDDRRPAFDVANADFSAAGVREVSFGNTYPVKVREARGDDVRFEEGGGWIGWSLYSGRATTAAATGSGLAVEEAGRQASIIVPLAELPPGARPLEMVAISSGSFQMGCPVDERGRVGREWPPHRVTITRAFQLGKYEVTQAQWRTVMGTSPAEGYGVGDDHPVYNVTWNDAQQFIARLNALGKGTFRLPTEAEWEYACRAGTTTRFSFGDALESSDVRDYDPLLDTHLWWGGNNGQHGYPEGAKQVGLKTPNPWGVHDLHGNVWEYCSDWWETAEDRGARTDPQGPASGTHKVMRGGAWESHALHLRSADRSLAPPDGTEYGRLIGLRLVREHPWQVKNCSLTGAGMSLLAGLTVAATTAAIAAERMVFPSEWPTRVELDINETRSVSRNGGAKHQFKLLSVSHQTMPYRRNAENGTIIYAATVEMEVDGVPVTLTARPYQFPTLVGGLRMLIENTKTWSESGTVAATAHAKDLSFTFTHVGESWGPTDARFPIGSFRWHATTYHNTWMGLVPQNDQVYYHRGEDFGAQPNLLPLLAPRAGLIIEGSSVWLRDASDAVYEFYHMFEDHIYVTVGQSVDAGCTLARTGGHGNGNDDQHLHVTINAPDGSTRNTYPMMAEAYLRDYPDSGIANAGGYQFMLPGQTIHLDASRSLARPGRTITGYRWILHDGTEVIGPNANLAISTPGYFAQELRVTYDDGSEQRDFTPVRVFSPDGAGQAGMLGFIYQHPVRGLQPGTPVTLMHNSWMVGVSSRTIDFGDGSPPAVVGGNKPAMTHAYAAPGLYTVTISVGTSQVLKTAVLVEGTVPANVSP